MLAEGGVPADGYEIVLVVSLPFYYCEEGGKGLCKVGEVVWKAPIEVAGDGADALAYT